MFVAVEFFENGVVFLYLFPQRRGDPKRPAELLPRAYRLVGEQAANLLRGPLRVVVHRVVGSDNALIVRRVILHFVILHGDIARAEVFHLPQIVMRNQTVHGLICLLDLGQTQRHGQGGAAVKLRQEVRDGDFPVHDGAAQAVPFIQRLQDTLKIIRQQCGAGDLHVAFDGVAQRRAGDDDGLKRGQANIKIDKAVFWSGKFHAG